MASPSNLQLYQYSPLRHPRGLRLIELHPGAGSDDIKCELFEVEPAPDDPIGTPAQPFWQLDRPYEAVSWTWGTSSERAPIRIHRREDREDYQFNVQVNAIAALRALRYESTLRILWLDTICINQNNADEKNHQVPLMAQVYGQAVQVCVWLGDGREINGGPKLAIDFIKDEVLDIWSFDVLCDNKDASPKWEALIDLMRLPWFSRRWVVQEIALARTGVLHCGGETITWKQFSDAVSLFVEVETATHRLSEVMKQSDRVNNIPDFFGHVPALGATTLVDAVNNLFRRSSDTLGEPLLSLEHLISSLTVFEAGVPHDVVYALLSIAKDTTPRPANQLVKDFAFSGGRQLSAWSSHMVSRPYYVDYRQPYSEVCREFVEFSIRQTEPHRALDIICRPWAPPITPRIREQHNRARGMPNSPGRVWPVELETLPSWISDLGHAAFQMNWEKKMPRANPDPLVGLPSIGQINYRAAGTRPVSLNKLRFKRQDGFCSMFVEGFILDTVKEVGELGRQGNIPRSWFAMANWHDTDNTGVPTDFWRTVVADRGPNNRSTPAFYPTACKEAIRRGSHGGVVDSKKLIHEQRSSIIAEFMRRVESVVWNRGMMLTEVGRLGLAREGTEQGHFICILYGCTVPVILQRFKKTAEQLQGERHGNQQAAKLAAAIFTQRGWRIKREWRKARVRQREELSRRAQEKLIEQRRRRKELIKALCRWHRPKTAIACAILYIGDSARSYRSSYRASATLRIWRYRRLMHRLQRSFRAWSPVLLLIAPISVILSTMSISVIHPTMVDRNDLSRDFLGAILLISIFSAIPIVLMLLLFNRGKGGSPDAIAMEDKGNQYYYRLIGECYVNGMMDGEAIALQNEKGIRPEVFELR